MVLYWYLFEMRFQPYKNSIMDQKSIVGICDSAFLMILPGSKKKKKYWYIAIYTDKFMPWYID